ncbi:hypothetical protein CDG79_20465 [Nostoc sp. 'Peltigera membranacea cyanobiont' 232]|nr:hypothetical protein CDG79_20465 [Nostoc sp. 'Peltigera membranacea cyanobiont' 232]
MLIPVIFAQTKNEFCLGIFILIKLKKQSKATPSKQKAAEIFLGFRRLTQFEKKLGQFMMPRFLVSE